MQRVHGPVVEFIRSTHRAGTETEFCWWSLQLFLAVVLHSEQHIASQCQTRRRLCDLTNYPLPYSRWFSVINRFRNCQVWLLVSTSKYFRDRRFQGKRSRNDESAWTNYLHVICVLMLNIEPISYLYLFVSVWNRACRT